MITMKTEVNVKGISGKEISDFMLNCTDQDYQKWWHGTHLAFHTIKRCPNDVGNLVYFDEYVGGYRLRFKAVVTEIISGKKLVWQMKKIVKLPAWLALDFVDNKDSVNIVHTLSIGFGWAGRFLDPILRVYFSAKFQRELESHAQVEFHKLAGMLSQRRQCKTPT